MTTNQQQKNTTPRLQVLIADDVQETRRSTRLMLSMVPTVEVVAIAQNGRQAIDLAKKHRPDIAIVDINMPEMDGLTAIQTMLQIKPEMGCIVMSAERDSQMLRKAITAGAREYLIKPFTVDELDQALQRVSQLVVSNMQRAENTARIQVQRDLYLERLASEYIKSRRADDQALEVFEQLAANPNCELRWLTTLALIYLIRQEWGKLKALAERLEQQALSRSSQTT